MYNMSVGMSEADQLQALQQQVTKLVGYLSRPEEETGRPPAVRPQSYEENEPEQSNARMISAVRSSSSRHS